MRLPLPSTGVRVPSMRRCFMAVAAVGLAACGGFDPVKTNVPSSDADQLFVKVAMTYKTVNLSTVAPYDTQQLSAAAISALGTPMLELPAPTFQLLSAADSISLTVTPDGLLRARAATPAFGDIGVVATIAVTGNISHADTTWVRIIDTPPPQLVSMSADPAPPDSNKIAMPADYGYLSFNLPLLIALNLRGRYLNPPVIAKPKFLDVNGDSVPRILTYFTSLDPTVGRTNTPLGVDFGRGYGGRFIGLRPGLLPVLVTTVAYGTQFVDTVMYDMRWPVFQVVALMPRSGLGGTTAPRFQPNDMVIQPNGFVIWQNQSNDSVDIVFDDPTHVGQGPAVLCDVLLANEDGGFGVNPECNTGNLVVPSVPTDGDQIMTTRVRQFTAPGIYTYHSVKTGTSGRIVVTDNPSASTTSDAP